MQMSISNTVRKTLRSRRALPQGDISGDFRQTLSAQFSTVDMPASQTYNDSVRKFTLNHAAFPTHLRVRKTSARMLRPTTHIFLYYAEAKRCFSNRFHVPSFCRSSELII